MVLGARSGKSAALFAAGTDFGDVEPSQVGQELERIGSFRDDSGLDPYELERDIKNLAWESAGVVRNENGLRMGIDGFEEIQHAKIPRVKGKDQRGWIKALECANLARVGEMVARSALERRESRGQHYREDYPGIEERRPNWIKIFKAGENVRCKLEPIPFAEGDLVPPGKSD
jgi:succinate dehydrogenase/fumarate reductase flavoprotein subunit